MISVTETAAEKINKSLSEQDMEGKALRLGVFVGGCSGGYQYALGPDQERETDTSVVANGLRFVVNSEDIEKVKGTEIDYVITEIGEGFRINNPNPAPEGKKGECGCGAESSCC